MQERLISLLGCPRCRGSLSIYDRSPESGTLILEGVLACEACSARYPIRSGIPRFVSHGIEDLRDDQQQDTAHHFTQEFEVLSDGDRDIDPPEVVEYFFYSRTGLDPSIYKRTDGDFYRTGLREDLEVDASYLRGKVVLDAGCGSGRFSRVAGLAGPDYVIGLDLGEHVDLAARRCSDLDNVDFIQGSVLEPPLKADVLDYIFSIGVLHHTPDPEGGCAALARALRQGGRFSVWVYPDEYWGGPVRKPVSRAIHFVMTRQPPARAFWICRWVLYPWGRLQMALSKRCWTKVLGAPLFIANIPRHPRREIMVTTIYDYFCPPIISTHSTEEVSGWFRSNGFRGVTRLPVPVSVLAEK